MTDLPWWYWLIVIVGGPVWAAVQFLVVTWFAIEVMGRGGDERKEG